MMRASKPSERPMFNRLFSFVTAAVVFGLAWNSFSQASEQGVPKATWTPVGEETAIPYGWVDFCNRHAEECALGKLKPVDVHMTRQVWKTLNEVNAFANSTIEPISNLEHWGTTLDHWDYPLDGKGDCKIYALFKRKLLIERGFPRPALLMTIVRDLNGEGHAVLTVKTDRGDFVLDNLTGDIRPWSDTGYQFFKRQAQDDPNVWLSLGGATGAAPTEAATN
jgi:predicted transglutaminase-like cysteine proteinase